MDFLRFYILFLWNSKINTKIYTHTLNATFLDSTTLNISFSISSLGFANTNEFDCMACLYSPTKGKGNVAFLKIQSVTKDTITIGVYGTSFTRETSQQLKLWIIRK